MKILFDLGGSHFRIGVSEDGKSLSAFESFATPKTCEAVLDMLDHAITDASRRGTLDAISGGIAGVLDQEGTVLRSPHLAFCEGKAIGTLLKEKWNCPVYLENDAALAGLAEAREGAGRGHPIVAYLTVSTGVGGARIVDGRIDKKSVGFEPGHQIINRENAETLEMCVSGSAFRSRYGKEPKEILDQEVWDTAARDLALGIHNTILHWSPDVVVLGGPMILGEPAISLLAIEENLTGMMKIFPKVPPLRKALLAEKAGLMGALFAHVGLTK